MTDNQKLNLILANQSLIMAALSLLTPQPMSNYLIEVGERIGNQIEKEKANDNSSL